MEPKFGMEVRITRGFFSGRSGTLVDARGGDVYTVQIAGTFRTADLWRENFELVVKPEEAQAQVRDHPGEWEDDPEARGLGRGGL